MSQVVKIEVTDKTKKHKVESSYVKYETPAELIAILEGEQPDEEDESKLVPSDDALKVLACANYGANLRARALARQRAEALAEGPEKQIAKAIAGLVAVGFTEAEATAMVNAKRASQAEPEPEEDETAE